MTKVLQLEEYVFGLARLCRRRMKRRKRKGRRRRKRRRRRRKGRRRRKRRRRRRSGDNTHTQKKKNNEEKTGVQKINVSQSTSKILFFFLFFSFLQFMTEKSPGRRR